MAVVTLTVCGDPAAVESGWAKSGPGGLVSRVAAQPGSSLVWLQAAQRPWPLSALVGPPDGVWPDVVGMPYGGAAPWRAAVLVAVDQQGAQLPVEPPSSRVHGDQAPVGRGRVQPAQPDPCPAFGRSTADVGGVRHELAGERGRDGRARQARRVQPRGGVVPVEQSRVGHDQPDLDADVVGVRLPREALGERVCHHLVARAWIAGGDPGPGVRLQGCPDGDTLGDRQEPGHPRHRVRGGPDAHPPVGDRAADPPQR